MNDIVKQGAKNTLGIAIGAACLATAVGAGVVFFSPHDGDRLLTACFNPAASDLPIGDFYGKRPLMCSYVPGVKIGQRVMGVG